MSATTTTIPLLINNKSVTTSTIFEIKNPATERILHRCTGASPKEAHEAAITAKDAFPRWRDTRPYARRDILVKAADIMLSRKEELIRYQCEETGAGRVFAEKTFLLGVSFLRDFACRIPCIEGVVPAVTQEGEGAMILKQPYGVVLGIAPWNAPYILGVRTVVTPLAAGNTVVLKGSELSPKCFWAIGDVFRQAGLPAGCLNVIYHRQSDAAEVTSTLIAHPAIRKITYTGSTTVGSIIAGMAAKHTKPVLLELGGKAAAIVLDDADLEKAAMACTVGAFLHSGQVCMSTERVIVQRSVAQGFRRLLSQTAEKVYGKNSAAPVLVAPSGVEKNQQLVRDAVSKGASVLFGDPDANEECCAAMRPVIVDGVTKGMDLYETESFGPTVSVMEVEDDAEAVTVANDCPYGLTAAIFTENLVRGLRMSKRIEAGAVHINSATIHDEPTMPHGGWKSSGFGRFGGSSAYDEFLQTKTVTWVE
ncbi:hypothetical protein MAP00_004602 [Monascus purpureus]|nr:hypothetical protein MAP00_004602 [Monascus purpureus]